MTSLEQKAREHLTIVRELLPHCYEDDNPNLVTNWNLEVTRAIKQNDELLDALGVDGNGEGLPVDHTHPEWEDSSELPLDVLTDPSKWPPLVGPSVDQIMFIVNDWYHHAPRDKDQWADLRTRLEQLLKTK